MKLVRYGNQGQEKPGLIDTDGQLRDLSAHLDDVNGAALSKESLAKLSAGPHQPACCWRLTTSGGLCWRHW